MDRVLDRVLDVGIFLSGSIMLFSMLSTSYEVGLRYFFHNPTEWVLEVNEIALVYMTFLGAAWVLKVEGHVKIDYVTNLLKPRHANVLNAITSLLCAALVLVLLMAGAAVTLDYYRRHIYSGFSVIGIPSSVSLAVIPIGSLLLFFQFLRRANQFLKRGAAVRPAQPTREATGTKTEF